MDGDAPIGDQQEQAPPANIPMTVSFRDANGSAVDFKMKPTTKLGKAMTAFSNKVGRDAMQLRFLFEGQRVVDDDTPTTVNSSLCGDLAIMLTIHSSKCRRAILSRCTWSRLVVVLLLPLMTPRTMSG